MRTALPQPDSSNAPQTPETRPRPRSRIHKVLCQLKRHKPRRWMCRKRHGPLVYQGRTQVRTPILNVDGPGVSLVPGTRRDRLLLIPRTPGKGGEVVTGRTGDTKGDVRVGCRQKDDRGLRRRVTGPGTQGLGTRGGETDHQGQGARSTTESLSVRKHGKRHRAGTRTSRRRRRKALRRF